MMIFLSIDPGYRGGYCAWEGLTPIEVGDLPHGYATLTPLTNTGTYTLKDAEGLKQILKRFQPRVVVVEQQQAVRGQGVSSTFQTGFGFGVLLGTIHQYSDLVFTVAPQTWTAYYRRQTGQKKWTKQDSVDYCINTLALPFGWFHGPRGGVKDGRADAVLIGKWFLDKCDLSNTHQNA